MKYGGRFGPFLLKRAIDVAGGIAGLILSSPFFVVIPIFIKLTSPGPVFFRQERVGLYGKKFMFYKFRTCCRWSGPGPRSRTEFENYDIWHRCRVVEVKPGITGLWQVMGRSSTTFDEMVRLDIRYSTREWSIWLESQDPGHDAVGGDQRQGRILIGTHMRNGGEGHDQHRSNRIRLLGPEHRAELQAAGKAQRSRRSAIRTPTRSTAPARRIRSSVRQRTAAIFSTRRTSTPWQSSRRYRPITSWPSGRSWTGSMFLSKSRSLNRPRRRKN